MSIFGSLFKLIKSIVSKLFKMIKKLFKVLLPIIIVVAIVYFGAPYLASFFSGIGAPAWLSSAITALPGYISSGLSYLWDKALPIFGSIKDGVAKAWDWYSDLKIGTQALIALGASYAISPEETLDLVSDIATGVGDIAGGVLTAALGSTGGLLLAGGLLLFFLMQGDSNDPQVVLTDRGGNYA